VKGSDDHFFYTILDFLQRNTDGKLTDQINNTLERYKGAKVGNASKLSKLEARTK